MDSSCSVMVMILPVADHFSIVIDSHGKIDYIYASQICCRNVRVSILLPDTWEVRKFYFYYFVDLSRAFEEKNASVYYTFIAIDVCQTSW